METTDWKAQVLYDACADDKLELTLFPTEHCNFRCTYCYEDFAIGRMKPDIVNGVKGLMTARAADLNSLSISWFGGEPLVAYDLVVDINRHAKALADAKSPKSIALAIGMTTNGYALSEKRFVELHESGLSHYQISLDGFGEGHDLTRRRADGGATFDKIWENVLTFDKLKRAGKLGHSFVTLRLHVHPGNAASCIEIATQIAKCLSPEWFRIFIKNVGHYGGSNDATFEVFDERAPSFADLKQEMMQHLGAYFPAMPAEEVHVCYAAKANAFTIRADGRVGKCTVALNSKSNQIGLIDADGRLHLDAPAAGRWLHALKSMSPDDLSCPIQNLHLH